jgi:HSP20 family protein
MTLIRWSPVRPSRDFAGFHGELNRFIDGVLAQSGGATGLATPPVDVEENAESFVLRVDLPGLTQQDVKVVVEGDAITLRGERKPEVRSAGSTLLRGERSSGTFERSFVLGAPIRSDQIRAVVRNGVLEVQVPKADSARKREIEVQAG